MKHYFLKSLKFDAKRSPGLEHIFLSECPSLCPYFELSLTAFNTSSSGTKHLTTITVEMPCHEIHASHILWMGQEFIGLTWSLWETRLFWAFWADAFLQLNSRLPRSVWNRALLIRKAKRVVSIVSHLFVFLWRGTSLGRERRIRGILSAI